MGDRPTFHLADDYVALMELTPCARTVYGLLRCNAEFDRNAAANHAVHVTSQWFTEMTSHWQRPMSGATARRGLNELISKKVLIRMNGKDGSGFLVAFVADPRGLREGPVNGFEHAKRVARRTDVSVYYQRKEERPGTPAVTGSRLRSKRTTPPHPRTSKEDTPQEADLMDEFADEFDLLDEAMPKVMDGSPGDEPAGTADPAGAPEDSEANMAGLGELTRLLVSKCHGKGLGRRGILEGEARRVAEACAPALEKGWSPEGIASQLSSLVSDKIHSAELFLRTRAADLGEPPLATPEDGTVMVKGKRVDLGAYEWDEMNTPTGAREDVPSEASPVPTSREDQEKKNRLAKLARQARRSF